MTLLDAPSCTRCGQTRDDVLDPLSPRPPCPKCGDTGLSYRRWVSDVANATDAVSYEMVPADQDRSWHAAWHALEAAQASVTGPQRVQLSGAAIRDADRALYRFLLDIFSLKDQLRADPQLDNLVESTINNDPDLALLADLANQHKHPIPDPNKKPRSGERPSAHKRGARSEDHQGWTLVSTFEHEGSTRSAVAFVGVTMDAWRRAFDEWGVSP